MNHRTGLWLLLAGSALAMISAARRSTPQPHVTEIVRAHERPWLSREATDQLFGTGGGPGPLFAELALGGRAPSPETRTRIARFAHDNNVEIRFETHDDELVAIRLAITYGGCCGYEGADTLGRRLGRPWTQESCGSPKEWVDSWSIPASDGVELRGRVRVNRVEVRWEPIPTVAEVLAQAESLLGQDRERVREAAGDRWTELIPNQEFLLEVPFPFGRWDNFMEPTARLADRDDLGFKIFAERGKIRAVKMVIRGVADGETLRDALLARWGHPRSRAAESDTSAETWRWKKPGLAIMATPEDYARTVELRAI